MKQPPYPAPDFSLVGDDDKRYELKDYRGQWLVVYFYPKDDTPGCTQQACSIRDVYSEFEDKEVKLFGISMDDPEDHRKFKAKYNLPFTLLSDPMRQTIEEYGAWGKKMFGKEGILRTTFIIDPNGNVKQVYEKVTPDGHGSKILEDITILQQQFKASAYGAGTM